MDAIERAIARAQRRWWVEASLRWLGWLALAGLVVAIGMVLAGDLFSLRSPWWAYVVVGAAAVAAAPVAAWARRPGRVRTAELIDRRLGLKDRLSTALYVRNLDHADPFARQVVADATRTADRAAIKDAFGMKLSRVWMYVPTAAAVLVLLALLAPNDVDLLGLSRSQQQARASAQQAQAARRHIVQAKASIEDLKDDRTAPRLADADQIMKQLASLSDRNLSTPQARREVATKISDLTNKLAQARRRKNKQFKSLANAMTRLDTGRHGPADRLADALRRGDFQAAQEQIKRLDKQIAQGNLSPQQKKQLKQQLKQMAKQLKQMAKQAQQQQARAQQQIRNRLSQSGLRRQKIQQLQKQGYNRQAVQKAVQKSLQRQGLSQRQARQQARKQAKKIQQQQQQSRSAAHLSQSLHGLGSSFGQMASASGSKSGRKQGQQGGSVSQFKQGAWSARRQMSQIAQMQQQIQKMGRAQSQLRQAMQQMAGGGKRQSGQGGRKGGGVGGLKAGTTPGGNPLGQPQAPLNARTHAVADLEQGKGRIIASWMSNGKPVAGQPKVDFDKTITKAQDQAAQAVSQDRVPRQYHRAIHQYFNQLPNAAKQARQAPAAAP